MSLRVLPAPGCCSIAKERLVSSLPILVTSLSKLAGKPLGMHSVLRCIAAGHANKEIADALSISEGTVKSHVNNIMQKLGALSRTDAAICALRKGLIKI
jgi:DNA-binding CsgD family transcriptional regulator